MKKFTDFHDKKIFNACEKVRIALIGYWLALYYSSGKGTINLPKLYKGSIIHQLIINHNWEGLFNNKDWKKSLTDSQEFMLSIDGLVSNLRILQGYFPEETEDYLFLPD